MINNSINRQMAIDAINSYFGFNIEDEYGSTVQEVLNGLPPAQLDLIAKIQNGIKATDADDAYSCGMRNGMKWCISLIDGKEPLYENCPSVQQKPLKYTGESICVYCRTTNCKGCIYEPMSTEVQE